MDLPNRKSPRLSEYDYSNQNYYYITICTHERQNIFGNSEHLNNIGKIAETELLNISAHFCYIKIDKYVIMPNHIHMIIVIGCNGGTERSRPFPTLSTIIGLYKSGVSKRVHETKPDVSIWQKSFYDRIIRNKKGYYEVWKYIDENPMKWPEDELYSL